MCNTIGHIPRTKELSYIISYTYGREFILFLKKSLGRFWSKNFQLEWLSLGDLLYMMVTLGHSTVLLRNAGLRGQLNEEGLSRSQEALVP